MLSNLDLWIFEFIKDQSLQVWNEVPRLRLCDSNCLELLCLMLVFHYENTNKKIWKQKMSEEEKSDEHEYKGGGE